MALTVQTTFGKRRVVNWLAETTAANSSIRVYEPEISMALSSVQVAGTFGSATVTFLGSNDGTTFTAITDVYGSAISFTAAGQRELSTCYRYFKPSLSGGTADSLNVYLVHFGA